ncbi:hypothetical protein P170DRAFT_463691 [Aspergillus steynii IBT 23096]|uniref:Uncharacterized protein n=1 Tax=Aspergillus steynii IBT 23096 TaxID=1392250 RepID=A0A2I2GC98_9EURO|nr:uncharacterized protein P170DRAFT_463691 [Aspergillus steynii IBT 23096]PLB50506.1 hypothetical protein P170DRAFT_463691 [Aspergillus steynii IBT 23096]
MEPASHDLECTVDDCQMALKTVRFERELQNAFGKTAQILETEGARIKRVEQLFLQFENENLRLQLDQINAKLSKALKAESDARFQFHAACDELDHLRSSSRISSNEIEGLQRKLASLGNANADSQRLVADNIRLSKSLASIKLEVEALRTQESSGRIPLAEKQDLERQLHSLELRMANERTIHEHTLARESQQATEIEALNAKLEEQSRRFAEEVQTRNRREHEIHQQSLEWTTQRLSLEKRLETLSRKLPSTKDPPQVASDGKQWTHGSLNGPESRNPIHRIHTNSQQPASRFNAELTIATPGAIQARERKKKTAALPGDKSSFSITPFLNRTGGPPDSPISSDGTDELHASQTHTGKDAIFPKASPVHNGADDQPQAQPTLTGKPVPRLAQRQQSEPPTSIPNARLKANQKVSNKLDPERSADGVSALVSHLATHTQSRPKKRKLGAQRDKNLFEGDDEEDELQEMKKPGRKLASSSNAGQNVGLDPGPLSASTGSHLSRNRGFGGFSDFSPLKRDKRRP